jgi:ribonuclease HII
VNKFSLPNLKYETGLWEKGFAVIGVDEVGRGAFAGPLFAGGVIFPPTTNDERLTTLLSYGINDSKKLKPNERKMLAKVIQNESLAYHISFIDVPIINRVGIGKATLMAMRNVVKSLREKLELGVEPLQGFNPLSFPSGLFVLVDGFYVKRLKGVGLENQRGIVNGDSISLSIAAASIIAKVSRDNHMRKLSAKYKQYGWGRNKGYGTAFHREAIARYGSTALHRTAFIKNILQI